jgi:hypothetical protein
VLSFYGDLRLIKTLNPGLELIIFSLPVDF